MKVNLYTVYDKFAVEGGPLFEAKNDDVARRAYKRMLQGQPGFNPEEYELVCVGSFDKDKLKLKTEHRILDPEYGLKEEPTNLENDLSNSDQAFKALQPKKSARLLDRIQEVD